MREVELGSLNEVESYAGLWIQILETPANGTATGYEELRRSVPLIEKLQRLEKEGAEIVLLEEAEWEYLCERVKTPGMFTTNSREVLDMCDKLLNAKPADIPGT